MDASFSGGGGGTSAAPGNNTTKNYFDEFTCIQEIIPTQSHGGQWHELVFPGGGGGAYDLSISTGGTASSCASIQIVPSHSGKITSTGQGCFAHLNGTTSLLFPPAFAGQIRIQRLNDTNLMADSSELVATTTNGVYVHKLTFAALPILNDCCPDYSVHPSGNVSALCGLPVGEIVYTRSFSLSNDGLVHVPGIPCVSNPITFTPQAPTTTTRSPVTTPPPPPAVAASSSSQTTITSAPTTSTASLVVGTTTTTSTALSTEAQVGIYVGVSLFFVIFGIVFLLFNSERRREKAKGF